MCQIRCISVHGGLLATWVKYIITIIIFIYTPFSGTHLQVRPVDGFSRMMAQTTRTRARMCLFGKFLHIALHLGGQKPQNTQFWGVNRRFQAKLAISKNVHIIKTTASIPTKCAQ